METLQNRLNEALSNVFKLIGISDDKTQVMYRSDNAEYIFKKESNKKEHKEGTINTLMKLYGKPIAIRRGGKFIKGEEVFTKFNDLNEDFTSDNLKPLFEGDDIVVSKVNKIWWQIKEEFRKGKIELKTVVFDDKETLTKFIQLFESTYYVEDFVISVDGLNVEIRPSDKLKKTYEFNF